MKYKFLLFSFLFSFVSLNTFGNEKIEDFQASKEKVIDQRENYFLTSTDYQIAPKVNPLSGEYSEEEVDLVVAGVQPLSARRFYSHFAPYDPRYASWRYNPESFLAANFEWHDQDVFVAVGEGDGSINSFKRSTANHRTFNFEVSKGFVTFNQDGASHPLNTTISYEKRGDPKDKHRFQYVGSIKDGSGRERYFESPMHRWLHYVTWKEKKGNWLAGSETIWRVMPNTWTPYHLPILEERLPNGNILVYSYTTWKDEKRNYPRPRLLSSITAYNSDKSKILNTLQFHYQRSKHQEVMGLQIKGSDGREATISHWDKTRIILSSAKRPDLPQVSYDCNNGDLFKVEKPEGRLLLTEYQKGTHKVSAQYAPVGINGEMCPIGRYEYLDRSTIVLDAEGNKTVYQFDEHKKITAIEVYQNNQLYKVDRFYWDLSTGNLLKKVIENAGGEALKISEYQYDKNQNCILEKTGLGNDWCTFNRTYSDDGFNLKLSEKDQSGKEVVYQYVPHTNLISSKFVLENGRIHQREFYFYDKNAACIKTIIDNGSTEDCSNLQSVTCRKITLMTPKEEMPCLGLPEVIEERTIDENGQEVLLSKTIYTYTPFGKILSEDRYDAEECHCYTITNEYDNRERLISKTDALGHKITHTYDANNNITSISGPRQSQHQEIAYDKANRPIRFAEWQLEGGILLTEKKYDKLGNVIIETDVYGNEIRYSYDALKRVVAITHPHGAIEKKEYDVLGNCIKEIDALGYETKKTYNCFGQILSISYPDGSSEHITYDAQGRINTLTDKNGAKTCYTYDVFDRPLETKVYSINGELLKKNSSTYNAFHKLTDTDANGVITTYTYDYTGRKIAETTDGQSQDYFYDSMGRLIKTVTSDVAECIVYDSLNRIVEKRTESINGDTLTKVNYAYDEAGNQIKEITSKGVQETLYNNQHKPLFVKDALGHVSTYSYAYSNSGLTKTAINSKQVRTTTLYKYGVPVEETLHNASGQLISKCEKNYDLNHNLLSETHHIFENTSYLKQIAYSYTYGPLNRLEKMVEAGVKTTAYEYDDRGRKKTLIKPDGTKISYSYDDLGRQSHYTCPDLTYVYTYNHQDQVTAVTDGYLKTTRVYDLRGNLMQETLENGLTLKYSYDNEHRRLQTILPDGSLIDYRYLNNELSQVIRHGEAHTYSKRDLEGELVEARLPYDLGTISIERDALSRIKEFTSPFYSSYFDRTAFDSTGNLLHYSLTDTRGFENFSYSYDELDQLISESKHDYIYDSMGNRLEKNGLRHTINNLNQLLNDGESNFDYDNNGNLIFDGQHSYTYDSLDRLTAVQQGAMRILFTYDAFNRRLSKTIYNNGTLQKRQLYLWDGDNEIGCITGDKITELRILGEGLGAEIGAAVFIELNGKTFIPIHDHRGCLVTLTTPDQSIQESYRYTAFGEEINNSHLSPWRFASKRVDDETGFVYFGRRYYLPSQGRWITPDPQGFADGPNLYAYLHNSPLDDFDLYGLWSWRGSWEGIKSFGKTYLNYRLGEQQFVTNIFKGLNHQVQSYGEWVRADFAHEYKRDSSEYISKSQSSYEGWKQVGKSVVNDPLGALIPGIMDTYRLSRDSNSTSDQISQAVGRSVGDIASILVPAAKGAQVVARTSRLARMGSVASEANLLKNVGIASRGAENANAAVFLRSKLSGLQKAQNKSVQTRVLPDGRIRYYEAEIPSRKAGPTRGACNVVEWNPKTGNVRRWYECHDYLGNVNRVHPKNINGQTVSLPHYPPIGEELIK